MKAKASISLSLDLLNSVDNLARPDSNRSEFIETAILFYLSELKRRERDAKDLEIINSISDELNAEMEDVLDYQVKW